MVDEIPVGSLLWEGLNIGSDPEASDLYLDGGIEGWGQPSFNMPTTPMQMGGEWGGTWTAQAQTYTANLWVDTEADPTRFRRFRSSMKLRPNPADEVPLAWRGLLWDEQVCAFVRPTRCAPVVDEEASENGAVSWDAQWLAVDPVVYSHQAQRETWDLGSPVSSDVFPVGNTGDLVPWSRRAFRWWLRAHGTVTNPRIRVDHADGTWEQILFSGLTMTGGQVLTIGPDMTPRVGSRIVTGYIRSTSNVSSSPSRAPRYPLLHGDDGGDPANEVTVSVSSGTFSGYCETRSTF